MVVPDNTRGAGDVGKLPTTQHLPARWRKVDKWYNFKQKKQRQKEFKERKVHQESLKVAAKKAKRDSSGKDDEIDRMSKIED